MLLITNAATMATQIKGSPCMYPALMFETHMRVKAFPCFSRPLLSSPYFSVQFLD